MTPPHLLPARRARSSGQFRLRWGVSLALLALQLACAGAQRAAAPSPEDCEALGGFGCAPGPGEPALGGSRAPLAALGRLRRLRDDVTLWRRNPGLALALERLLSQERAVLPVSGGLAYQLPSADFPTPRAARSERRAALAAARRAWRSGAQVLVVAPAERLVEAGGEGFNTVALWACGRNLPVYTHLSRPIDGVLASADGRYLAVVHVGRRGYLALERPLELTGVEVAVVDLESLSVTGTQLQPPGDFAFQSVALAWERGGRLRLWLRDVVYGPGERVLSTTCDVHRLPCALPPPAPGGASLPAQGVLEVTGLGAWMPERPPAGLALPAGVLARSIHPSPDGRHVAFVTEAPGASALQPTRTLWVRALAGGGPDVEVARAGSHLHHRWLEAEGLVWEAPPEPAPELAGRAAALGPEAEVAARARSLAGEAALPEDVRVLRRQLALEQAATALKAQGRTEAELWRTPLRRYSPATAESVEHHPGRARLWSHLDGATWPHRGPVREVPAAGADK